VNLSQNTVVAPSSATSTGIFVSKATFISVARIVKLPSFAMSRTFDNMDIVPANSGDRKASPCPSVPGD